MYRICPKTVKMVKTLRKQGTEIVKKALAKRRRKSIEKQLFHIKSITACKKIIKGQSGQKMIKNGTQSHIKCVMYYHYTHYTLSPTSTI